MMARVRSLREKKRFLLSARGRFVDYCTAIDPTFQTPWHVEAMCHVLERVERREIRRLMIFMPPRHSKTETTSIKFPAWWLGRHPQDQVLAASYSDTLATANSRACRDTFQSPAAKRIFGLNLANDAESHWQIEGKQNKRASYIPAGVGGSLTGEGADLLLIDDPIKDARDSHSIVIREGQWNWYNSTARTRLHPNAVVIVILTRWHADDLAGRLLKKSLEDPQADKWHVLMLPATNDDGADAELPAGAVGIPGFTIPPYVALWPERYPRGVLDTTKAADAYWWRALYQQRPTAREGTIIKREWLKFYRDLPMAPDGKPTLVSDQGPVDVDEIAQSWDAAFKDEVDSSFVVGQAWVRKGYRKLLLDQLRDRMNYVATCTAIRQLTGKFPASASHKFLEDKANGPAIEAALKKDVGGFIMVEPRGDKAARLQACSSEFESGMVELPDPLYYNTPWVSDYIEELCAAPTGAFWDQCDATSQILDQWKARGHGVIDFYKEQYETQQAEQLKKPQVADSMLRQGMKEGIFG